MTRKRIQIVLAVLLGLAVIRVVFVVYERKSADTAQPAKEAPPLEADYYVVPKKLHDYDLKSLRQDLTGHTVWIREGYRFSYFPYDAKQTHGGVSGQEAGTLGPIERLEITDVVEGRSPEAHERQLMAVFSKDGKQYAFPVGAAKGKDFEIFADEILFIQDPHELYKHWTPEVWDAISKHQIKPGMNELQASFAIGMGVPETSYDSHSRTVKYPNGGHPIAVTYRDGHATQITGGR